MARKPIKKTNENLDLHLAAILLGGLLATGSHDFIYRGRGVPTAIRLVRELRAELKLKTQQKANS